jgi:hypothetical protein
VPPPEAWFDNKIVATVVCPTPIEAAANVLLAKTQV